MADMCGGSLVAGVQAPHTHHGAAGQQLPVVLQGPLRLVLVLCSKGVW